MDIDERRKRLQAMLKAAGTNAASTSLAIGRTKDYIRDFLIGRKRGMSAEDWQKIERHLASLGDGKQPPNGHPHPPIPKPEANGARHRALCIVFREVFRRIGESPEARAELANHFQQEVWAEVFASIATAPQVPDAVLADEQAVRQQVETFFHFLNLSKPTQ